MFATLSSGAGRFVVDSLLPQVGEGGAVRRALLAAGDGCLVRRIGGCGVELFFAAARKSDAGSPSMEHMPSLFGGGVYGGVPVP
jgi:hypothetical protein